MGKKQSKRTDEQQRGAHAAPAGSGRAGGGKRAGSGKHASSGKHAGAAGKSKGGKDKGPKSSGNAFSLGIGRTIRGSLKRFISLAVICTLGVAMFIGLTVACKDLRISADEFFDEQDLFDIRVVSTLGLDDEDLEALAEIEGVESVEGGYTETAYVSAGSVSEKVDVKALSESGVNEPSVVEGRLPESDDEIAVTEGFLIDSGLSIGDTVTFSSESDGDDEDDDSIVFERKEYTIVGSVLDPMNINASETTMSFRSSGGSEYSFFLLSDCVTADAYTVIYLQIEGADEVLCYSDEYEDIVEDVLERVEAISEEREQARTESVLSDATAEIDDAEAEAEEELDEAQAEIDEAQAELDASQAEVDEQLSQIETLLAQYGLTIDSISSLGSDYESAYEQLVAAQEEIDAAQAEIDEAQSTLDSEREDAQAEIEDARAELDEIEDAVWYVQDRSSLASYSSVESDASSIESIGNVIPIVFLVVAILISLTTMTRMVDEERTLIGLYKALGYSRGRILSKYALYALAAVTAGVALGYLLGYIAMPLFLFSIFSTMYTLPAYSLHFDLAYAVIAYVVFAVAIVGATIYSCQVTLREAPASLMRPKTPKAGARILLERIKPIWKRMSFLNKVTARNLFRYKRRFFMTVVGIAGTTALLVCGFGIRDTVVALSDRQYGGVDEYDVMAVASSDDLDEVIDDLLADEQVESLMSVYTDSVTVKYDGESVTAQLVVVPDGEALDGYIDLFDGDDEGVELAESGALVTKNAQQVLGFSEGEIVTAQDSTLAEGELEVADIVISYLGNSIYLTESAYEEAFGADFEANCVLVCLSGTDEEKIAFADELGDDSRLLSVVCTQQLIEDFSGSVALINTVVYLIIAFAAALSFTVVFTLSNTNISERDRELATIKVLGFRRKEVHTYINKETIILTIVGVIVGLPLGWALTSCLEWVLKMPSLYFAVVIEPVSYLIAALIALVFTLIVNQMTNRTLDRIDMVEALKSTE